jgi:1-acyl-sn-glycerol-3-phosphate acyltransferase
VLAVFGIRRLRGRLSSPKKAEWLHWACKFVLRNASIRLQQSGIPPHHGLIVSNHLSYLDILLYGAAMPCVFVSKVEVRSWPLFGLAASCAGTIFIDRSSRASAAAASERMQKLLAEGIPVLLFPEGTSSDGSSVLKFHSSLFEPAVIYGVPVSVSAIRYLGTADYQEKDLCYYGDIHFAPHLLETMGRKSLTACINFSPGQQVYSDRRIAANQTREAVIAIREAGTLQPSSNNP